MKWHISIIIFGPHRDGLEIIIVAPVRFCPRPSADNVIRLQVSALLLLLVAVEGRFELGWLHNVVVAIFVIVPWVSSDLYLIRRLFENEARRSRFIGDVSPNAKRWRSLLNGILVQPHHRARGSVNFIHLLGDHMNRWIEVMSVTAVKLLVHGGIYLHMKVASILKGNLHVEQALSI